MAKRIPSPDEDKLRTLYWDEGLSTNDLANKYGVSGRTARRWLERNDIPKKDRIEASIEKLRVEYAHLRMLPDGHYIWTTTHNCEHERVRVPRLLAIAEYGFDAVCDKVVHHKNEIPWDDRPDNIELMEHDEHTKHHTKTGSDHHDAKLTPQEAREIKNKYENTDKTQYDVADEYGVDQKTVSKIVNGKAWKHAFE